MVTEARARLSKALEAFGLVPIAAPSPIDASVSNVNYRVETAAGPVFLRAHRLSRPLDRLQREQAGAAWAASRGLPVATPLPAANGDTIVLIDGQYWSAYRWVDGQTCRRGSITPEQAHRLGAAHGRTLVALRDYPGDLPSNSELNWSTAGSLAALDSVAAEVARRGTAQEQRWHALQREFLVSGAAQPDDAFAWLAVAPAHGDFHERNVIFGPDGELAAVVDWERFCLQPPAFEVLRAASFMLLLEDEPLQAYGEGFREHASLDAATIPAAVEAWWQSSAHNTWAFRDTFADGSKASRQFLPEEEHRAALFRDRAFREWLTGALLRFAA